MHLNKKEWPSGLDTMKSTKQKERDKVQSGQKVCIRGGGRALLSSNCKTKIEVAEAFKKALSPKGS